MRPTLLRDRRRRRARGEPRRRVGRRRSSRRRRARPAAARRATARRDRGAAAVAVASCRRSSARSRTWTLENGLRVEERRIPIGVVGANFEARPNVALDVAGQLLKSLNAALLRTGGAALRTVTALVDEVLRPALERAGLPPGAVGLVRSADREGARALVSMPKLVPLVILRGSGADHGGARAARGASTASARSRTPRAAASSTCTRPPTREKALALIEASLDRLGVCNRLNLLLVDRACRELRAGCSRLSRDAGVEVREPPTPLGHEWANDPEHVATVTVHSSTRSTRRSRIANEETSGLAAGIVTEDAAAAERFLDGYRGTAVFWHAPTRFTDGFALTGAPETGINVDWVPGPRGPVTYRDLWLRQYRVDRRRDAAAMKRPLVVKLGSALVLEDDVVRGRARGDRDARPRRHAGLRRLVRRGRPGAARARRRAPAAQPAAPAGCVRTRSAAASAPLGGRARSARRPLGAGAAHGRRDRRAPRLRERAQHVPASSSASASSPS